MTAIDAAVVQIMADFGRSYTNFLVRCALNLGTGHPAVHARYGARLARLRHCGLDRAIRLVEEDFRAERRTFEILHALGMAHDRHSLEVLRELRLILRFARRSEYRNHYRAIAMLVAS